MYLMHGTACPLLLYKLINSNLIIIVFIEITDKPLLNNDKSERKLKHRLILLTQIEIKFESQ